VKRKEEKMKKGMLPISFIPIVFILVACGILTSTTKESTQPAISRATPEGMSAAFDFSTANQIPPEGILEEISFYGGGGGVFCAGDEQFPKISYEPMDGELMTLSTMIACGWQAGEVLIGAIQYPDGRIVTQTIPTDIKNPGSENKYYAFLGFKPAINDPVGLYYFTLEGKDGKVEADAYFSKPTGPHIFRSDNNHLFLYGFAPNETVKLIHYGENRRFAGWQEYRVDLDGNLSIEISVGTNPFLTYFFAIGDQSGETRLLQEDYWGRTGDRIIEQSIAKLSCGGLQSRLAIEVHGRVAYTDGSDMRIRARPGITQDIVYKVPEGTQIVVIEGPKCVDEILWWKVRTNDDLEGWMAEYLENVYLIEPFP
jgi:hypothetical protein